LQAVRHELFEALGRIGNIVDVLKAISVSARLAGEKLDKVGATLARLVVRVGEPEAEDGDDN
jgi:hypothetical protein